MAGVPEGVAPRRPGPPADGPQQANGHHSEELSRLQDTPEVPHARAASAQTRTQETGACRASIWHYSIRFNLFIKFDTHTHKGLEKSKLCLFSIPTSYRSNLCMYKAAFFSRVQIKVIPTQATTYHMFTAVLMLSTYGFMQQHS